MSSLFVDVLGKDRVHVRPMTMGGEDFSQFARHGIRSFYFWVGTAAPDAFAESKKPDGKPLASTHSPYYAPVPEPTLRTGVLSMTAAILELAGTKK